MIQYECAFWNLENLFDEADSPRRTEKLQRTIGRELNGWNRAALDRKIFQLASVIGKMNGGNGPDLLGVCEVENRFVLECLVAALKPLSRHYEIAHADTEDRRGIDVAFLYDADRFSAAEKFSHYIVKRSASRDLFQVNFHSAAGRLLIVIGNHWPSRSGGVYESEPYRIMAAETLAYFHQRIEDIHGRDAAVLALGDFNDEPHDRSLVEYALSDRTRKKVTFARTPHFLNLMWQISGQGLGTHYYNNAPGVLDQFLASRGLLTGNSGFKILPETVQVVRFPEMVHTGAYPVPVRFGRGKSMNPDGFSDHFPIAIKLREKT